MKNIGKIALLALGFGMVFLVFFSKHARIAKAQTTTGVSTTTQLVTLRCSTIFTDGECQSYARVFDNGTSAPFTIPPLMTLVVTDVEAVTVCLPCTGFAGGFALAYDCPPLPTPCESAGTVVLRATGFSDPNGYAYASVHLTTGIPFVVLPTAQHIGTGEAPVDLIIHGYLAPSPLPVPTVPF